jgi:hypothetical protein
LARRSTKKAAAGRDPHFSKPLDKRKLFRAAAKNAWHCVGLRDSNQIPTTG